MACGWNKTIAPNSDVLTRGHDYFEECPQCAHTPLQSQAVDEAPAVLAQWTQTLEKWLKR